MKATGSPVKDPSEDSTFDLTAAVAKWNNFRSWHHEFCNVPGFSPQSSISSTSPLWTLKLQILKVPLAFATAALLLL